MRKLFAVLIIAASIAVGCLVGVGIFIAGVNDIADALRVNPVAIKTFAWGLVQCLTLAESIGGVVAWFGTVGGLMLWAKSRPKLKAVRPTARQVEHDWDHITGKHF